MAIGAIHVMQGLAIPSPVLLRRGMRFRRLFPLDVGSAAGLAVGVAAALALRTVWALVLARLATVVALVALSYAVDAHRPRRRFSGHSFRQLSAYGRWILGSAILSFIFWQGSNALSGVMFGVAALGLYQMAGRFGLLANSLFAEVLQGGHDGAPAVSLGAASWPGWPALRYPWGNALRSSRLVARCETRLHVPAATDRCRAGGALLGAAALTIVFHIGAMAPVAQSDSPVGLAWHVVLIVICSLCYAGAIGICQLVIPRYAPLAELRCALGKLSPDPRHATGLVQS